MESPTRAGRMKRKLSNDQEREDEIGRPSAQMKRPRDGSMDRPPSLSDAPGALDTDRTSTGGSPVSLKAKDDESLVKVSPTLKPAARIDDTPQLKTPVPPSLKRGHSHVDTDDDVEERSTGLAKTDDGAKVGIVPKEDAKAPTGETTAAATVKATGELSSKASGVKEKETIPEEAIDKTPAKPFVNGFSAWKQGGLGKFSLFAAGGSTASTTNAFGGSGVSSFGAAPTNAFGASSSSVFGPASPKEKVATTTNTNPLAGRITSSKNGFEGFASRNPLDFLAKSPVGENIETLPKIDAFKDFAPRAFGSASAGSTSTASTNVFGQPKTSAFSRNPLDPPQSVLGPPGRALGDDTDPFTYVPEKEADVFGRKRSGTPQPEPTVKGDRTVGEGEEEEITECKERASLYYLTKEGGFQKRGVGVVKLNVGKNDDKARLIMRADGTLKVILNTRLYRDMSFTTENRGQILKFGDFDGHEYSHYGLRFGNLEAGQRFYDAIHDWLPRQGLRLTSTGAKAGPELAADKPPKPASTSTVKVAEPASSRSIADVGKDDDSSESDEQKDEEDQDDDAQSDDKEPDGENAKASAENSEEEESSSGSSSDDAAEEKKAEENEEAKSETKDAEQVEPVADNKSDGVDKEPKEDNKPSVPARASSPKRKYEEIEDPEEVAEKEAVTKEMKRMRVNEPDKSDKSDPAEPVVEGEGEGDTKDAEPEEEAAKDDGEREEKADVAKGADEPSVEEPTKKDADAAPAVAAEKVKTEDEEDKDA